MRITWEVGAEVVVRPRYGRRNPTFADAHGVIADVWEGRALPVLKVLWLSGPWEGRETKTPWYMVVPVDQLAALGEPETDEPAIDSLKEISENNGIG